MLVYQRVPGTLKTTQVWIDGNGEKKTSIFYVKIWNHHHPTDTIIYTWTCPAQDDFAGGDGSSAGAAAPPPRQELQVANAEPELSQTQVGNRVETVETSIHPWKTNMSNEKNSGCFRLYRGLYYPAMWGS